MERLAESRSKNYYMVERDGHYEIKHKTVRCFDGIPDTYTDTPCKIYPEMLFFEQMSRTSARYFPRKKSPKTLRKFAIDYFKKEYGEY